MNRILALIGICLFGAGCAKSSRAPEQLGLVLGVDMRSCPCAIGCPCACGGTMFQFTENPLDSSIYYVDNPEIFHLPANAKYPVKVSVAWENTTRCGVHAIRVDACRVF